MTEFIGYALIEMIQPFNIFLMIIGLTGGIVVGALPGLTATMGVALMVPVTCDGPCKRAHNAWRHLYRRHIRRG